MSSRAILIADEDPEVLRHLRTALACQNYPVLAAAGGSEALHLLREHRGWVSLFVLDLMMQNQDGLETLREARKIDPELPVVVLLRESDPERIAEALQAGAGDFLTKPVAYGKLLEKVRKATLNGSLACSSSAAEEFKTGRYLCVNPRMKAIAEVLEKVAGWNVPVVLRGESGVGKEVLAHEIHRLSPRADRAFVKINCVALPSELLESELFGYERGAFTGAFKMKPGKFEMADGGTILLDEIGDMDLKLQAKLLQVLQDGEFHRLGGKDAVQVDARVLVATHCDLEQAIAEGLFREDLYYRLNVVSVAVPPLRERRDEILPLAEHFLEKHRRADITVPQIPSELRRALVAYHWPGNVRELENAMRRYLVFRDPLALMVDLTVGAMRSEAGPSVSYGAEWMSREAGVEPPEGYEPGLGEPPGPLPLEQLPTMPDAWGNGIAGAAVAGGPQAALEAGQAGAHHGVPHPDEAGLPLAGSIVAGEGNPSLLEASDGTNKPATSNGAAGLGRPETSWYLRVLELETILRGLLLGGGSRPLALRPLPSRVSAAGEGAPGGPDLYGRAGPGAANPVATLDEIDAARNRAESQAILAALQRTEWNRKKAAALLDVDYKALLYRMKKLGIGERVNGGSQPD